MKYPFECSAGHQFEVTASMANPPAERRRCTRCHKQAKRVWLAPMIHIAGDPDEIPQQSRVTEDTLHGTSVSKAIKKERAYAKHVAAVREAQKGRKGGKLVASIPTEVFHGKIRQTGDKRYWDDPANLAKHKAWKV